MDDVAALQDHLGLEGADLLGHSAGANIAVRYAVRNQRRVSRLLLITPSGRTVGLEPGAAMRREIVRLRQGEPWFAGAAAAFERIVAGAGTEEDWQATAPFYYGRWDAASQAHDAAAEEQTNEEAAEVFAAEGAFDPAGTRAALAAFGALFPAARLVVQPGAGHYPWLDDADRFVSAVMAFLHIGFSRS